MKNGKAPTREQKKIMKAHGLVPENWLVVKNLPDSFGSSEPGISEEGWRKIKDKDYTQRACNWLER